MKRTLILTALSVTLLLSAQPRAVVVVVSSESRPDSGCAGFELAIDETKAQEIDDLLRPNFAKPGSPGAEVTVLQDGKIRFLHGYGLSDITHGIPISEQTVFNLASVSKQFTAMAILKLIQQGKLSLDDILTSLLPEFASLRNAHRITVRHLLTHTSGLPDYLRAFTHNKVHLDPGHDPTNQDVIRFLTHKKRLRFIPGNKFDYSDSGYVVLAQIVEAKSGMRFAEFMKQTFFDPLGMSNTFVRDERRLPIPHQANAYDKARNGFKDVTTSRLDSIYGDGNAFSTVCDLAKWLQTILDILLDDRAPVTGNARIRLSNIIVPIDALKRAFSQVVLNNQSGVTYGFGWTVFLRADLINGGDSTLEVVFHTGVWNGVRTFIGIIPNRGQGVIGILLSNFGKFEACEEAGKIAHLYLRDVPGIKRFVDCRGLH